MLRYHFLTSDQELTYTLRVGLTLWYGTALALVLMIFSVVLYAMTARNLRDTVDESLEETATTAVRSLEERGFLPLLNEEELLSQFPELTRIDKFFQIFSPSGTIRSVLRTSNNTKFAQSDGPRYRVRRTKHFRVGQVPQ